jgi:hypothetical protein
VWLVLKVQVVGAGLDTTSMDCCFLLLSSPANMLTQMARITRKCLTYSHVHDSDLRGPPSRRPLSRELRDGMASPRYADARLWLSHPSLQVKVAT